MQWFWDQYTTDPAERALPTASPLRATSEQLAGLPPALVITGEADVLRDEGEAYANHLRAAGVPVTATRYQAIVHDFVMLNALRGTNAARAAIAQAIRLFVRHSVPKMRATRPEGVCDVCTPGAAGGRSPVEGDRGLDRRLRRDRPVLAVAGRRDERGPDQLRAVERRVVARAGSRREALPDSLGRDCPLRAQAPGRQRLERRRPKRGPRVRGRSRGGGDRERQLGRDRPRAAGRERTRSARAGRVPGGRGRRAGQGRGQGAARRGGCPARR